MIATCALLRPDDVPSAFRELAVSRIEEWIGEAQGSCRIIAPRGDVIAEAPVGEETILTASVSLETVLQAKAYYNVGGHYSRPDILQLHINRQPLARLVESDAADRKDHEPARPAKGPVNDDKREIDSV